MGTLLRGHYGEGLMKLKEDQTLVVVAEGLRTTQVVESST